MQVPLFDLKRQYQELQKEILPAVDSVFSSGQVILSHQVEKFEEEIAHFCGTEFAIGVANGSDALYIAVKALNLQKGDLVITTPYTFFATVSAITRNEAFPLFVDIDAETLNIDLDKVEQLLLNHPKKEKIKALLPVPLFGQACDLQRLQSIQKNYQVIILEDVAQSLGSFWAFSDGSIKKSGSVGEISTLSFFPTKNLGAYGDAGMILTSDRALFDFCTTFRVHGSKERYFHDSIGINSRLDEVQAAILRVKFQHLQNYTQNRIEHASFYHSLFEKYALLEEHLSIPKLQKPGSHVFHQYVIQCKAPTRDKLRDFLTQKGIGTAIYYPRALHLQKCFDFLGYKKGDFPISESAANHSLALPMFPELRREEIEYVVTQIADYFCGR